METLEDLRQKIDAIDDEILQLLANRTEIVKQVGKRKNSASGSKSFIRAGREASMLRNLTQKNPGSFPKAAIAAIWRVVICGSLSIEQGMHVFAYTTPGNDECYWLSREYFCTFTPIEQVHDVATLFNEVQEQNKRIGVLPMPWQGSAGNEWWLALRHTKLKIFACIPFMLHPNTRPVNDAVAIANVNPEPTGDDTTLLAIESDKDIMPILSSLGIDISRSCIITEQGKQVSLVYAKGFYTEENDIIESLSRQSGIGNVTILGAYANPIVLE